MIDIEFIVFVSSVVFLLLIVFGIIGVTINTFKPDPVGKEIEEDNYRYFITDISGNRREVTKSKFEREERQFGYVVFILIAMLMLMIVA